MKSKKKKLEKPMALTELANAKRELAYAERAILVVPGFAKKHLIQAMLHCRTAAACISR
ncbi:MAG TPA: hypothetical protein VJB56_01290 [Candidatus Paceibacterota bacterium]